MPRVQNVYAFLAPDEDVRAEMQMLARADGRQITFVDDDGTPDSARALERVLPAIEVLVCGRPAQVDWSGAQRLRLVHVLGAGVDGLLPAKGLRAEVAIANARGIHGEAMRDHVLAMILAFERDLLRALAQQRDWTWEPWAAGSVSGRTLALVGLGEVGRPIASAAAALGMRVIGVRRSGRDVPPGVAEVFGPDALGEVVERADYVVLAVPLTTETRGLFSRALIERFNPNAVLVNVSRGGIVDEDALLEALGTGAMRGAAIDVFTTEPLPADHSFWTLENAILTPHIAGWMPGYISRAFAVVLDNVARLERGEPPRTLVDRERGY